jgi:hypothetical protein
MINYKSSLSTGTTEGQAKHLMNLENSIVQKFSQRDLNWSRKTKYKQSAMIGKTNSNLFEGVNVQFWKTIILRFVCKYEN